jgi:hypothetical protein
MRKYSLQRVYRLLQFIASCCTHGNGNSQAIGACFDGYSNSGSAGNSVPSITADPNAAGCSFAAYGLTFCASATPSFTGLSYASQAQCLCYDNSGNFIPDAFDDAISSCYNYAVTADPTDAPDISSLLGFCTAGGRGAASTTVAAANTGTTVSVSF